MENKFFLVDFHQLKDTRIKTRSWSIAKRWLNKGIQIEASVFGHIANCGDQIWPINPIADIDIQKQIIYTSNGGKYEIIGRFFYTIISETKNHVADDFLVYFFQSENVKIRTRNWKKASKWLKKNIDVDVCLWEETLHERGMRIVPVMSIGAKDKSILSYSHGDSYPLQITGCCYCYHSQKRTE